MITDRHAFVVALLGIGIPNLAVQEAFWWYLRTHHSAVWQSFGAQGFFDRSFSFQWKYAKWLLFSGAYEKLEDGRVTAFVWALRAFYGVLMSVVVSWIFLSGHLN